MADETPEAQMARDAFNAAQSITEWSRQTFGRLLDFTPASLEKVEVMLAKLHEDRAQLPASLLDNLAYGYSCYVLEVARRRHGGRYSWWADRETLVLIAGEPDAHIAIMAKDKVIGRLGGDEGDNIPFFFEGFAERMRDRKAGDQVTFV